MSSQDAENVGLELPMHASKNVLENGHLPKEADLLEGSCHSERRDLVRLEGLDWSSSENNAATVGDEYTDYHVEHCRLASSIWSDDSHDLPIADHQTYVADRMDTSKRFAQS